jgi:hypothetical protein
MDESIAALCVEAGFDEPRRLFDLQGIPRTLAARYPGRRVFP